MGIYRSETFARKLEAQEWAAAIEREIEAGRGQLRPSITLREVMHDYARDVSPSKRGCRNENIRLLAFCREPFSDRNVSKIGTGELAEWRDERIRRVSAATVLRDITLLSSVFEYARRERRLIDANPVRDLRKPSAPRRVAKLDKTKNGDSREVPLSLKAVELLEQMRGVDPVRVFTVSAASRDALFRKAKKRAGIVGLTFHDSRALALTRLSKKLDVLELARMVGHRDVRSLMIYYRESAEEIAKKL